MNNIDSTTFWAVDPEQQKTILQKVDTEVFPNSSSLTKYSLNDRPRLGELVLAAAQVTRKSAENKFVRCLILAFNDEGNVMSVHITIIC